MPNKHRSETFNKLSIISSSTSNTFEFEKSIDFCQLIDPALTPFTNSSGEQWGSAVLAPNGKIYAVPSIGNTPANLLEFRRTFPQLMNDWILCPQFNKL